MTNLQGDVVAILDNAGISVVEYTYDAWGNLLSTSGSMANTLGADNPLRYRGYVYDTQTRLYYLQSRYYNPEAGRFINADALVSTGQGLLGNNMFAYCRNNPVCRMDASGYGDVDFKETNADEADVAPDEHELGFSGSVSGSSTGGVAPGSGNAASSAIKLEPAASGGHLTVVGAPAGEKQEIHHIVEQCQTRKSGFSKTEINKRSNRVAIPKSVHRKISGHFSSKPAELDGLRVRDWLAGKTFEEQYEYGMKILQKIWEEIFGE